jgi:myo-inositol catabolism protein IolC
MTNTALPANLGFTQDLFILPFDHRGSFQEKLFGIKGRAPTAEETALIASYKDIIYEGFKKALKAGVPQAKAGILVDEQFGTEILEDARKNGYTTCCPAEKSGQDEFDFEYGSEFGAHINKFKPSFVKILVRYNPESPKELNTRQAARIKKLSDYCHQNGNKFMFELLVPATPEQLAKFNGETGRFDKELRPTLMVQAMQELQELGIEPDVWKLEGVETREDCVKVTQQATTGGRSKVGVIMLGRGENAEKVKHWLATAANVPGCIGFAVGRTTFWEPLKAAKEGKISRDEASTQVANNYKAFCDLWVNTRGK